MTVVSAVNRKTFAGDDATTSFATTPVKFFDTSDLLVYVTTDATGVTVLKTEGTHYTVSGGDASAGAVGTVNTAGGSSPHGALLTGTTLVIARELPLLQGVDFVQNDASNAETAEGALDKIAMIQQRLDERMDRAVRLPDGDVSGANPELPASGARASSVLGFDADGEFTTYGPQSAVTESSSVTFLQSGAGAVATTVQEKLREGISIVDFGAVEGADVTSAFVSAFTSLPATGGIVKAEPLRDITLAGNIFAGLSKPVQVIFGPGTVTLTASQDCSSQTNVKILSRATVFNSTSAISMFNATSSTGFEFRGSGRITGTPTAAFDLTSADRPFLEFTNGLTSGIRIIPAPTASDSLEGPVNKFLFVNDEAAQEEFHTTEILTGEIWIVASGKRTAQTGRIRLPVDEYISVRRADDVNDIFLLGGGPVSRNGFALLCESGAQGIEILNRLLTITNGTAPNVRPSLVQVGTSPNRGLIFDMQGTGGLEINKNAGTSGMTVYDGAGSQLFRAVPNSGFILSQNLVERQIVVTYSTSMTPNAQLGNKFNITATNGVAFTINAPSAPTTGQRITITIFNTSGGALGAVTWNAVFKMDAWVSPGNGNNRSVDFQYNGTSWHELSRSAQNIPN